MKTRIISALAAIALMLSILILSMFQPWCMHVMFSFIGAVAAWEMAGVCGFHKAPGIWVAGMLLAVLYPLVYLSADSAKLTEVLYLLYALFLFLYKLVRYEQTSLTDLITCGAMTAYTTYGFGSLVRIWVRYGTGSQAMFLVVLALVMAWFSDSGAYFVGVFFGKHKLCPKISPKKTIEGLVGGIAGGIILTGLVAVCYTEILETTSKVSWTGVVCVAGICSALAVVGDLLFSSIKRHYGCKDFGTIMPGHGGALDRFDSVLIVAPVFGLLLQYLPIIHA